MKRDVDVIRQLLFDIEQQGPDCAIDAMRNGCDAEISERTRYHVRLLIDAGLAKEMDRTSAGLPCIRLTNAGHEFLDLCRSPVRWREAKWVVQEQTGGLSLTVLRAVLTKWAVDGISRSERHRRWRRSYRPYYHRGEPLVRGEPVYRVDSYRYGREPVFDDESERLNSPRPEYYERMEPIERWNDGPFNLNDEMPEGSLGVSLPVHMI